MSDTESFEQLMKIARYVLCNECGLLDNFGSLCLVHDNDCSDCQKSIVARIKAAHDREIRDTAQQAYHRGFEAGRHSMDAEHRAVAMRLRQLPLDGDDTYENLLSIGQAIWHDDFGCTLDGGSKLRDELVRLMGGVSDENVHVGGLRCNDGCMGDISNGEDTWRAHDSPSTLDRNHMAVHEGVDTVIGDSDDTCDSQCHGACADCDGGDSGEHEEVEHGGIAHDSAVDSRGGDGGGDLHMAGVTYDVLWNERQKAVCELRKLDFEQMKLSMMWPELNKALGVKISNDDMRDCDIYVPIRDRLIHLLGGDKPSGIDVLREMDEREGEGRITDELRECVNESSKEYDDASDKVNRVFCYVMEDELLRIADCIDEQFDRICQQQEAVLQDTIDELQQTIDDVVVDRDSWKTTADMWKAIADDMGRERAELRYEDVKIKRQYAELCVERADLLDLLRDARDEYVNMQAVCDELRYQREELMRKWMHERAERKELQAKLDRANGENKGLRLSIIEQKEAIAQRKNTIKKLTRDNEKVWKTVHGLQAKLDSIRDTLDG